MKEISNIFHNINRYMVDFILCFIIGDIAVMIMQSMAVWVLFERFGDDGAEYFSVIVLIGLLMSTVLGKKYSYLLDKYSRIKSMLVSNAIMIALMVLAVVADNWADNWINSVWLYAVLMVVGQLYFMVFYPARSAVAQAMIEEKSVQQKASKTTGLSFKQLNSILVITDKFGAILSGAVVAGLFVWLSVDGLIWLCVAILSLSSLLFMRFREPSSSSSNHSNKTANVKADNKHDIKDGSDNASLGFQWYFSQPVALLVTLALFVNIVIMLGNTIQPIYLYDVLSITPEMMAYIGIAFNIGALLAGVLVNFIASERQSIYVFFAVGLLMALAMAIRPSFEMFVVASGVLGFAGNANRVMFSSLIMQEIDNRQVATFFGLQASITRGIQFLALLGVNALMMVNNQGSELVVWFFPATFILVPVVWVWAKSSRPSDNMNTTMSR